MSTDSPQLLGERAVQSWRTVWVALVAGAVLVGLTLRVPRGSAMFYLAGYALAAVWVVASIIGRPTVPLRPNTVGMRAQIAIGALVGVVMFGVFVGGAAIGRRISVLEGPIDGVLARADAGPLAAVLALALVNAVAEELFFRGLVIDRSRRLGRWKCGVLALALYVGVTAVAGNTALTIAAVVMGAVFVAERLMGADLATPITTHLVWSTLMLLALPR
ncbi:MAG: putative metal-dependent rane protease [Ilumatobacteraceae bacterium]|nr:putative metal-dependent rane protease [Ilumatobacteraceae bacterium]